MAATPSDALAVLTFWFDPAHRSQWFVIDRDFDEIIRSRFAGLCRDAADGKLAHWVATPEAWLALLIVLDQFPRNLYRDDPRAWAQDPITQRIALSGIAEGLDRRLPPEQRVFAYMPFEHAEDLVLQDRCVALLESLCREAPPDARQSCEHFLDYARRHQAVIARFGRFPHRNALLGRPSTPEELTYLAEPGAGF